jgi:hypothetical protein
MEFCEIGNLRLSIPYRHSDLCSRAIGNVTIDNVRSAFSGETSAVALAAVTAGEKKTTAAISSHQVIQAESRSAFPLR